MTCCALNKHHAMKTWGGNGVQLHTFLTLVLDGGEWSASCPGLYTSGERAPGTHWNILILQYI